MIAEVRFDGRQRGCFFQIAEVPTNRYAPKKNFKSVGRFLVGAT